MSTSPDTGIAARLRQLEARLDAWAARRLSPEEYAEAVALDGKLKRNFWRLAGAFVLGAIVIALLALAINPGLKFGTTLVATLAGLVYVGAAFASAWYGYRKWSSKPVWKIFLILVCLVMGGGILGFSLGMLGNGTSLADISAEKYTKAAATTFMLGMFFAVLVAGFSRIRLRDAAQTAARLQAQAEGERLARQHAQAELKLLQAQVEPHFLFNTLANVRYLVQTGSPDALAMLDHLIVYLRTAVPEIRSDGSTLAREVDLSRAYLEIMRLRMGGALEFSFDIPEALRERPFPPMMLITLVENAIKHGVAPLGRGTVNVRASAEAGVIRVEVDDDGRGLAPVPGRGVGLANVRARLRALHGDAAFITIEPRAEGGTRALIQLPEA